MSGVAGLAAVGWAIALGLAMLLFAARLSAGRRSEAISRALHELRRPLQALALGAAPGLAANGDRPSPLELAMCALSDLDRVVSGEPVAAVRRLLRLRPVVEACLERWGRTAGLGEAALGLDWRAGAAAVVADPHRIAQALDNLVVNAIEHGSPPVRIRATICDRGVRIVVEDAGDGGEIASRARDRPRTRAGRGLEIVAGVAAEHGGRFAIRHTDGGTTAMLELPLASLPLPALATPRAA